MAKTCVLDTNVLLHDPNAIYAFSGNHVVIPFVVIEEIDNQKRNQNEIGRNARMVSRELDSLRRAGNLSEGVQLDHGGTIRIELNHQRAKDLPRGLDLEKHDNRILVVANNLT